MKDNQAKYPQLRFKGFTDPWEQRKLNQIAKITFGQSPDGKNYTDNPDDHILVQGNADMKNGHVVPRVWTTQVTKSGLPGDLIFSVRAPVGDVGITDYPVVLGRGVAGVRASEFVFFLLEKLKEDDYWTRYSSGSTFEAVNSKDVKQAPILRPSAAEQQRVGTFLSHLDTTIALHQRKLAKLKKLKQGYLQKLFPQNGSKFPQLRFAGFADAWERRKLSRATLSHNSGVYIPKDLYGQGTNIIGVGDIYDSDTVDGRRYRLAPVSDDSYILQKGDLLYGESSLVPEGIARVVDVNLQGAGTAFAWHTRRFKVKQTILNSHFLCLELNYWFPVRSHLMRTATKAALTGITTKDFFSSEIVYPSLIEQERISKFIKSLDDTIALHQRKLEKLHELKKGYLQKMFC